MTKKILVLSRHDFIKFVNSLTPKQVSEIAFISIRDFNYPTILPESHNVLNLQFDDAEDNYPIIGQPDKVIELFNDEMARQIIQFTENNLDKNLFVVHCLMGQSRSGAVGGWLADKFEVGWESFKRLNPQVKPNALVKLTLQRNDR